VQSVRKRQNRLNLLQLLVLGLARGASAALIAMVAGRAVGFATPTERTKQYNRCASRPQLSASEAADNALMRKGG
jgi:hypothetical protein